MREGLPSETQPLSMLLRAWGTQPASFLSYTECESQALWESSHECGFIPDFHNVPVLQMRKLNLSSLGSLPKPASRRTES